MCIECAIDELHKPKEEGKTYVKLYKYKPKKEIYEEVNPYKYCLICNKTPLYVLGWIEKEVSKNIKVVAGFCSKRCHLTWVLQNI